MTNLSKYIDRFQIGGFVLSTAVAISLVLAGQDTTLSLLIGLVLGVLTQLFDLQARIMASDDRAISQMDNVVRSLKGVDVRQLTSAQEMWTYVAKRVQQAEKMVDDMTISASWERMTPAIAEAHKEYLKAVSVVFLKKSVKWREVMAFPYFLDRAETMLGQKPVNYHIRYCEFDPREPPIQLLQFMIVDAEEVILASYGKPEDDPIRVAVKHPDIVTLFQNYYNSIWESAEILREGDEVGLSALPLIREKLTGTSTSS